MNLEDFVTNLSFDRLTSNLSPSVKSHVVKVYSNMAVMLGLATLGTYLDILLDNFAGGIISTIVSIVCLLGFYFTDERINQQQAQMYLYTYSLMQGMSLAPLISFVAYVDPSLIFMALGATFILFTCFSLSALNSSRRDMIYTAGLLSSWVSIYLWMSFINFFVGSRMMYTGELYLGLMIFSLFVIFDTQIMIAKAEAGSKLVLRHSLELFMDFIQLFVKLLQILLEKKEKKKRRERDE
ncbi:Bax inhibitor 1 [Boothiomyces sp. JEL0838]|nr:Bax inhibitor 1 [Boothiomyces sp. JEL0838]